MDNETAIVLVPEARLGALTVEPEKMIERATAIAKILGRMILDRKLYTEIKGKKFVRVEGWSTLGAMLGVLPREVEVKKLEDGYEATVELIRAGDGLGIGRGSAICLRSEKRWASADEYAVRSMAITRATGKAFRLGLSWIIKLAGDYEPTPAEEMDSAHEPEVVEGQVVEAPTEPQRPYSAKVLRQRMAEGALHYEGKQANDKQYGLTMGMMELCFAGKEESRDLRHSLTMYLFGVGEQERLTGPQVLAALDWLKPKKDSGGAYAVDPMAISEAQSCIVARRMELGQEALFGPKAE